MSLYLLFDSWQQSITSEMKQINAKQNSTKIFHSTKMTYYSKFLMNAAEARSLFSKNISILKFST